MGLKRCPDSAYYAQQKGLALHYLNKSDEASQYFSAVLEKFHRYAKTYPPTAEDLLDVTFRSLWQYSSIKIEAGTEHDAETATNEFFRSLQLLELFDYGHNKDYGENLVSPRVAQYGSYVHALTGDIDMGRRNGSNEQGRIMREKGWTAILKSLPIEEVERFVFDYVEPIIDELKRIKQMGEVELSQRRKDLS